MTDDRCRETRESLSELALGIADGAERARMLEHVADCTDCRRELERQSAVADALLALAPEEEPPVGFELGVLRAIQPPAPRHRRALWRRLAVAAAVSAAVAVAVTVAAMQASYRDDRRLAGQYRDALATANGTYFGARELLDPAGRRGGVLFVYQGAPSWILVKVDPERRGEVAGAELVDRTGRRIPLRAFELSNGSWGGALPIDLQHVAAVELAGANGRSVLVARL